MIDEKTTTAKKLFQMLRAKGHDFTIGENGIQISDSADLNPETQQQIQAHQSELAECFGRVRALERRVVEADPGPAQIAMLKSLVAIDPANALAIPILARVAPDADLLYDSLVGIGLRFDFLNEQQGDEGYTTTEVVIDGDPALLAAVVDGPLMVQLGEHRERIVQRIFLSRREARHEAMLDFPPTVLERAREAGPEGDDARYDASDVLLAARELHVTMQLGIDGAHWHTMFSGRKADVLEFLALFGTSVTLAQRELWLAASTAAKTDGELGLRSRGVPRFSGAYYRDVASLSNDERIVYFHGAKGKTVLPAEDAEMVHVEGVHQQETRGVTEEAIAEMYASLAAHQEQLHKNIATLMTERELKNGTEIPGGD